MTQRKYNRLHEFLADERDNILALCSEKLLGVREARSSSEELEVGLPVFYDELIEVLRADEENPREIIDRIAENIHREAAVRRGKESLKLGYTISQVVHGYGALCQAITEYAEIHCDKPIAAREFNRLNSCLDMAIGEAATEFNTGQNEATARDEVQRLGYLAHEMRNALVNASMAHLSIKKGLVGISGSTNLVLENALTRMKNIIDRSLSEVRLRGDPNVEPQRCRVIEILSEIEATALVEAGDKAIQFHIEVATDLIIMVDRHLVISEISNVVQNAIKFTKHEGNVWIRADAVGDRVLIKVEDECGGLPPGKIEDLFRPFSQKGTDRRGLGLGLSIAQRAVALNDGEVSACDIPGKGCEFTISLPRVYDILLERETTALPH